METLVNLIIKMQSFSIALNQLQQQKNSTPYITSNQMSVFSLWTSRGAENEEDKRNHRTQGEQACTGNYDFGQFMGNGNRCDGVIGAAHLG